MADAIMWTLGQPAAGVLIGIVLSILSGLLAWVLYRKALPRSKLEYAVADLAILGNEFPVFQDDLEIRFKGNPVPRVTLTVIAFWNSGNQTIHGSQIVASDSLRLALPETAKILTVHAIAPTRSVLGPAVELGDTHSSAAIKFDFLDPGDGFAVSVVHSGNRQVISILGTLRGVKEGPRRLQTSRAVTTFFPLITLLLVAAAISLLPELQRRAGLPVGITSAVGVGALVGMILLQAFIPTVLRHQRMKSFPAEMRKDPFISQMLPAFVDHSER